MKKILSLLLTLILTACTTTGVTETPVVIVNTHAVATSTPPSIPATIVPSVTPTITVTPQPHCDPFTADFCIKDGHFVFQRPIQPPANDLTDLFYSYGSTAKGTRDPHHGVEFANASGTPVHAAAEGTIIFAGSDQEAVYAPWGNFYGNLVVIEHQDELFTLYAHLSTIDVTQGQNVFAGDKIGEVGSTGGAIGSHLHFEVRRGDVEDYFATQNPELWLVSAKEENGNFFGTLMIVVMDKNRKLTTSANFTIGHYLDPAQAPAKIFYATSYSPALLTGEENAALSGLSAGQYRIVVETNGQMLERWVEVKSGKLTQVVFVVK
jgi:hypothetical protein